MSESDDTFAEPRDVRDSQHDTEGDMGVSSERTGPTGPGQHGTDGVRDISEVERDPDEDTPLEQSPGNPEINSDTTDPKSGYSSVDPRSPE